MRTPERPKTLARPGGIVPIAMAAAALAGAVLVSMSSYVNWSRSNLSMRTVSTLYEEPSPHEVEVAIRRAGLTPERLAAAGVGAQQVTAMVVAARTYLSDHQGDLDAADSTGGAARAERDRLQRLLESGLATENDIAALGAAQTQLDSAEAARDVILEGLYAAATSGIGGEARAALVMLKAGSVWDLPTPYLAIERSQTQWVALRDDLANLRIAAQLGEEPDPGCEDDVMDANADPAVSAASTNLANNLTDVSQAWTAAIGG
jgi:hypothetical protein